MMVIIAASSFDMEHFGGLRLTKINQSLYGLDHDCLFTQRQALRHSKRAMLSRVNKSDQCCQSKWRTNQGTGAGAGPKKMTVKVMNCPTLNPEAPTPG